MRDVIETTNETKQTRFIIIMSCDETMHIDKKKGSPLKKEKERERTRRNETRL